uniref:Uncharacterized protein n=1 Tax=Arundo donax TaxID=35708 RepID=A0A0A9CWC7_ARUDO
MVLMTIMSKLKMITNNLDSTLCPVWGMNSKMLGRQQSLMQIN